VVVQKKVSDDKQQSEKPKYHDRDDLPLDIASRIPSVDSSILHLLFPHEQVPNQSQRNQ